MSKVIIIDDRPSMGKELKLRLMTDPAWAAGDVEFWHINDYSNEKLETGDGKVSYVSLGWQQAFDALKTVDARVLILDLQLHTNPQSPIVAAAKKRIGQEELLMQSLMDNEASPLQLGALAFGLEFLSHESASRDIIFRSQQYGGLHVKLLAKYLGKSNIDQLHFDPSEIDKLIARVRQIFGSVEGRIWGSTETFFDDDIYDQSVPHNCPIADPAKLAKAQERIKQYLEDELLECEVPAQWFLPDQFSGLYNELKHLVGDASIVQTTKNKKGALTIGCVALLFAATIPKAYSRECSQLLRKIDWSNQIGMEILPDSQDKGQARNAVRALVKEQTGLFPCLNCHETENRFLVTDIALDRRHFAITYAEDFSKRSKARPENAALIEKLIDLPSGIAGNSYNAFRDFILAATRTLRGFEMCCALSLYVTETGASVLEFRPIAR